MPEPFTLSELQHIMGVMNSWDCPECSAIRQKVEKMIAEYPVKPLKTQVVIGGHTVTRERL
jgi:hypothetical protein